MFCYVFVVVAVVPPKLPNVHDGGDDGVGG